MISFSYIIQPEKSLQAALFETICESFVVLLNGIDDAEHKDSIFMVRSHHGDCSNVVSYHVMYSALS